MCTYAAYAIANFLQKANSGSNWRLSSKQVGETECSFVSHFPGPRGISPGYFCPSRASSQCFSQAPCASRSQYRLSSFLLTKYGSRGCNAQGCANTIDHRPTNTRSCFSASIPHPSRTSFGFRLVCRVGLGLGLVFIFVESGLHVASNKCLFECKPHWGVLSFSAPAAVLNEVEQSSFRTKHSSQLKTFTLEISRS